MPMEAWLRGPVDGVTPLLMSVAHMLQHAHDDGADAVHDLTPEQIWTRPGGGASIGFHVRHLIGALDRLFSYARGQGLTADQLRALKTEGDPGVPPADAETLTAELVEATSRALDQVRATDPSTLLEPRTVGRQRVPSTVLGLLVHGGEHSARHAGQAITLKRVVLGAEC
ncbi:MAG: DinB family protein [Vicinamibacteria bacterium]|nr:DinB family protein [Vicinamibacteria bacterium]